MRRLNGRLVQTYQRSECQQTAVGARGGNGFLFFSPRAPFTSLRAQGTQRRRDQTFVRAAVRDGCLFSAANSLKLAAARAKDCWSPKHLQLCHHSKLPARVLAAAFGFRPRARAPAESAATRSFVLACPESFVRRPGPRQPVPKARHVLSSGCPRAGPRPASAHDHAETSRLSPYPVVLCARGCGRTGSCGTCSPIR